ncbi:hypothetical protein ACH5RR_039703 [Cinchona calisaya]|uniref:Lachrymatory factor synthase n=1 Tax=Cinchona calisaya TaxID=153742 RepID=A0ABD2Y333_9GENT
MEAQKQLKWEGKAIGRLKNGIKAESVWPLLEDFCSIHKWLPTINTCYQVEGVYGQPGLVRYCGKEIKNNSVMTSQWCHEKLIAMDPVVRCLSYEVLENNMGFKSYIATIKLATISSDADENGCQIEWSFLADPVEGLSCEVLLSYLKLALKGMVKNVERALL